MYNPKMRFYLELYKVYFTTSLKIVKGVFQNGTPQKKATALRQRLCAKAVYAGSQLRNDKLGFTEFPYLRPGDNQISRGGPETVRSVYIAPNRRKL